jgi:RNA polymerase sigma-70 factor, ECF subfamily
MVCEAMVNTGEFQLVSQAQAGSGQAFEELMNTYMDQVFGIALRIVRNPALAEDVTQEVFINVYRRLDSFRGDSTFSTWLYRITVNSALRSIKKESRYITADTPGQTDSMKDPDPDPEQNAMAHQEKRKMRDLIEKLPKKQRAVLALRVEKDLSFKEIARIMGRSVGGVKANYFQAVKKLKTAWNNNGGDR